MRSDGPENQTLAVVEEATEVKSNTNEEEVKDKDNVDKDKVDKDKDDEDEEEEDESKLEIDLGPAGSSPIRRPRTSSST